ncbi:Ribose-5-phosphate isomerase B [bioreactor metagenome]|jgi:ribose 5-phosphate isomerase B|uniref:Ribose-5-phosphate isomerase B n=1 Tax=bioreactor metagenome TaxID=1076179 RepID=A0A645D1Z7_9ZZZZ
MEIFLGADHGGFAIKQSLKEQLMALPGYSVTDCGAETLESTDDYPYFAFEVAERVADAEASGAAALGILLCRSGSGMAIAANKVKGARAVEIYDSWIAQHAKSHNHANVLCFAADQLGLEKILQFLGVFWQTELDNDERHLRRLREIHEYEEGEGAAPRK